MTLSLSEFGPAREHAVIPEPEPEPESRLKRARALGRVLEFAEALELSFRVRLCSLYLTVLLCIGVCFSIRLRVYHRARCLAWDENGEGAITRHVASNQWLSNQWRLDILLKWRSTAVTLSH